MNFELRKVKFFDEMSEETSCFKAEIWENGKKIADVENTGKGGCNDIYVYQKEGRRDIYNKYMDLELEIMEMADEFDRVRQLQGKGLVLKKDGKLYTQKFPMPISKLKKASNFNSWKTDKIASSKLEGYQVMNRNL